MGVQNFLPNVLKTAGRPIDLCHYADVYGPGRSLRVAIDVSSVIYKATQGFADMLTDGRHLDNFGRAELFYQERNIASNNNTNGPRNIPDPIYHKQIEKYALNCTMYVMKYLQRFRDANIEILVVIDGQTPPIKLNQVKQRMDRRKKNEAKRNAPVEETFNEEDITRRIQASRRAGAGKHYSIIVDSIVQALRKNRIPFLVAPYESDGQLAFLSARKYVDLVVTEDSDLIACGASPLLYKVSMKKEVQDDSLEGVLLRMEDLACAKDLDLMDVSSAMLAAIFVAAGSDYCESLKGIGIKTACNAARKAFHADPSKGAPLASFLGYLYGASHDKKKLTDEYKKEFENRFLGALFMFRHPIVYNPITGRCECFGLENPDPELILYRPYASLVDDESMRSMVIGKLTPSPLACYIAEGWFDPRTLEPRKYTILPDYVEAFYKDFCKNTGRRVDLSTPTRSRPTSITTALFSVEDPKTISERRKKRGESSNDVGSIAGRRLCLDAMDTDNHLNTQAETQQESQPDLNTQAETQQESQPDQILSQLEELAVTGPNTQEMDFETQPMME